MHCPRCRVQISESRCPHCGTEITPSSLFDYRLDDPAQKATEKKVVVFAGRARQSQAVVEKPLIRKPVSASLRSRSHHPKQQALTLESPAVRPPAVSSSSDREEAAGSEIGLSHEVLFSRMLAGMIDLSLPVLIAFVFSYSASKILNFDFFSANSVQLGVVFSFCFFFLNSFFFLVLSGQTPGMYLTDLQLVGEESETVSFQSLLLRVCLFLPVAATVVGLLWSVFDPWCRCVHDRLSKTRVVPISHGSVSRNHAAGLSTSFKN